MTRLERGRNTSEATREADRTPSEIAARQRLVHEARVSTARVVGLWILLGLLYSFAPYGRRLHTSVVVELSAALVLLCAATVLEFRRVARSEVPEIRAFEAVGVILPLVLLPFAAMYYVTAEQTPDSFNEALSRLDAFYFTMTTFATVGFGDIAAKSEAARTMVTVQIVVDLALVGFIAKALLGTAQRRRSRLQASDPQADPESQADLESGPRAEQPSPGE